MFVSTATCWYLQLISVIFSFLEIRIYNIQKITIKNANNYNKIKLSVFSS